MAGKVDIPLKIGVFAKAAKAADGAEENESALYLQKMAVPVGESSVTVVVDGEPYEAGIDPFNELIDRVSDDNRERVTFE